MFVWSYQARPTSGENLETRDVNSLVTWWCNDQPLGEGGSRGTAAKKSFFGVKNFRASPSSRAGYTKQKGLATVLDNVTDYCLINSVI